MIIKICGVKTFQTAMHALESGADMLGFNFYPSSPRYIPPDTCAEIIARLKSQGKKFTAVGVFVNEKTQKIQNIMDTCTTWVSNYIQQIPVRIISKNFRVIG